MKFVAGLLACLFCSAALATGSSPRTLSFEDRVKAQTAIERVYYSHQLGTTKSFDDAVPKAVIEKKVRHYLEQTAALNVYWKTAVTDEMLQRELARMTNATRMPERLSELYAALGNDPFIIKECLARATLVDRLTRNFYAFDSNIHADARQHAEEALLQSSSGELSPSTDNGRRTVSDLVVGEEVRRAERPTAGGVVTKPTWDAWWTRSKLALRIDSVFAVASDGGVLTTPAASLSGNEFPCAADDTWDHGAFDPPSPRAGHTAVWTGSLMVVWGGSGTDGGVLGTGGKYDPATDSWTSLSTVGAPSARTGNSAVWTGSLIAIWGGHDGSGFVATGGRYDPATDDWTPTSTSGAPSGRTGHATVWTGSQMVIWGGSDGSGFVNTGSRYDPATDDWTPTSTSGAPSGRSGPSAVWTGNLMVVWGGEDSDYTPLGTGGRYDPETDSWTPTSTIASPSARYGHSAVWTGSVMVVWGGALVSYDGEPPRRTRHYLGDGGRYDPASDTWTPTATTGRPSGRSRHTAVWTGSVMVVWGGFFGRSDPPRGDSLETGGRYDPATNSWAPLSMTGAPSSRFGHTALWAGDLMIVWGGGFYHYNANGSGVESQALATGGRYDPATNSWTPTSTADAPSARFSHTAVWTGTLMIVWGGDDGSGSAARSGGRYDPATNTWTPTSTTDAPSSRSSFSAVWTGNLMVIWGGDTGAQYVDTGGRYDPASDSWTATSTTGAPSARGSHTAVWTGSLMVVWGGASPALPLNVGGRYDPTTDSWTPMATTGAPSARWLHGSVWTGNLMLVWGGSDSNFPSFLNTGGRYDPVTDSWTSTSTAGAPSARELHTAVWTGTVMLVWGGNDGGYSDSGGRYDPATDTWTPMSTAGAPEVRMYHVAVWTGNLMVVWGGFNGQGALNSGGRYDPATDQWAPTTTTAAPTRRHSHTAVWTGSLMVVWGGWGGSLLIDDGGRYVVVAPLDGDSDGYTQCQGDCNDAFPAVHPGAAEFCNGIDDDCDGVIDNGTDALCDDRNTCTDDSCNRTTGTCSNLSKPDGTVCDDASLCTTGETCQSGTCTPAFSGLNHPQPKSSGYYKQLCQKREHNQLPYRGDRLTDADAVCVGALTSTFAGFSTTDDICNVIHSNLHGGRNHGGPGDGPNGRACEKGEDELIATALNICRARVCEQQSLDSHCHGSAHTTVSQAFADADAILDDPARNKDTCKRATCELREINNGHALEMNSLLLAKESSTVRLIWSSPVLDDGSGSPSAYELWRRPLGSNDAFVRIGTTAELTFLDTTAGTASWEYDITAVIPGD